MTSDSRADWFDGSSSGGDSSPAIWPWVVAPGFLLAVAVVAGGVALGFSDTGCGCQPAYPTLVLDFDHDAGAVEVTHEGGDSVSGEYSTESLTVHVNGERRRAIPLPFVAGDSVVVADVEPGDEIQVIWTHADGDRTRTMAQYTVPDE